MLSHEPGKTAHALRQVSTLPHRKSDGYFLLFNGGNAPINIYVE